MTNPDPTEATAVMAIMLNVRQLMATNPIAFYEFVSLCRDRTHRMWGNTLASALTFGLVERDGRVHELVREAVKEHVIGDDLEMRIV